MNCVRKSCGHANLMHYRQARSGPANSRGIRNAVPGPCIVRGCRCRSMQRPQPQPATSSEPPGAPAAAARRRPRARQVARVTARTSGRTAATVGMDARQVLATVGRVAAWSTVNGYRAARHAGKRKARCKRPQSLASDLKARVGFTAATVAVVAAFAMLAAPLAAVATAGGGYVAATAWRSRPGAPGQRARKVFAAEIRVTSHLRKKASGGWTQVRSYTRSNPAQGVNA